MKNHIRVAIVFALAGWPMAAETQAQTLSGRELFEAKRYAEATAVFEALAEKEPANAEARAYLGRLYFRAGDYDTAKDHLEQAVKLNGSKVDYHLWLGTIYRDKARTSWILAAAKWARRWKKELEIAHKLDPTHIHARRRLIAFLMNAPGIGGGDKKRGTKIARETIPLDETEGRLLLAYALTVTKQPALAREEYDRVLAADSSNGRGWLGLGNLQLAQNDLEAAEASFLRSTALAPKNPNTHERLGDYFTQTEQLDQATAAYYDAVATDPEFATSRYKLAQLLEQRGMQEDALRQYELLLHHSAGFYKAKDIRKKVGKLRSRLASKSE